ncbi:MAG: UDP-N-acetylmuramoyl-L-alanyl-D-glutamate--2,6-diaminopimelate ligase [Clostridia bacterium]|nr:UDP-N-acetylmuramoyl-L-alanyl-D-glutamate--2,6-diaminopimelate ligase [Clostridia bacterium]
MQLDHLLKDLAVKEIYGDTKDKTVYAVRTDSRIMAKGELFIALNGENYNGHDYMKEAQRRGAVAIVCQQKNEGITVPQIVVEDTRKALSVLAAAFYSHPEKKLKIIGITGTNGKTTTCHYLASILREAGKKTGIIGTLGTFYEGVSLAPDLTTPDPPRLFRIFSDMLKSGVEYVVMEVSAHAVYFQKVCSVDFAACIFTNCTQDHLDFFGDMENYKRVKESLFTQGNYTFALVNTDDALGVKIARECKNARSYGIVNPSDNFAVVEEESLNGSRVLFNLNDELCDAQLRLTGKYNVYNALAAAACAHELKIDSEYIARGIYAVEKISGRLESVGSVHGGQIFVDFAHTPDGLENALSALKERCKGKLLCVFGCGGNRDAGKRPLMGEIAGKLTDFCVLTSDNPRYEEPYSIISAIENGYRKHSRNYVVVQDRRKAIEYAMRRLQTDDVLLIAGKGGENYQEIMGIKYDYNDNAVVKEVMQKMLAE